MKTSSPSPRQCGGNANRGAILLTFISLLAKDTHRNHDRSRSNKNQLIDGKVHQLHRSARHTIRATFISPCDAVVACVAHNHNVVGPIPTAATIYAPSTVCALLYFTMRGMGSTPCRGQGAVHLVYWGSAYPL